ncbi:hypothetical protein AB6B38_12755 [Glycocaulis abyssi]|uniref:DUF1475 domain-containing protein n=1 Tax=Glycocaulis abyssi TaxID=1433403 RepID=A0ABV9NGH4_9PROT
MTLLRVFLALGGIALLASIIWASQSASIGASFSEMIADPWGVVALIDLYLGFVFLAVIIWLFERNKLVALAFILPLPVLGNVWAAAWIVWRLGALATRLNPARAN